ncbi:Aste57867_2270 [Aphanomyces stellatus]|uniref:Aste57867_2270 protein n=1 Tax=Aphanomyces stellatus TaxID=120398 RepID=A0A485K763_9STRA|nr:hypothetical protein As57867_002265 [Aphanomyces stellatus]VFT79473.1 Aste57867_2270 [Aphanomyces stellatus]
MTTWPDVDIFAHAHGNHFADAYHPIDECIALPVQSNVAVFKCRRNPATGTCRDLEVFPSTLSPSHEASETSSDAAYRYIAWSASRPTYLAAATLHHVNVWLVSTESSQSTERCPSVFCLDEVPSRICGLKWNPQTSLLMIHTTMTLYHVSFEIQPNGLPTTHMRELKSPLKMSKQVAAWNAAGTRFLLAGGSTLAWFAWSSPASACANDPAMTGTATVPSDGPIVGLLSLGDVGLVVTTERKLQLAAPAVHLTESTASSFLSLAAPPSGIIDLSHMKSSTAGPSLSSLVLPELHASTPFSHGLVLSDLHPFTPSPTTNMPSLDDHLKSPIKMSPAPPVAAAVFFEWTTAASPFDKTKVCLAHTSSLALPHLAVPDMLASVGTDTTHVVAFGSSTTASTVVLASLTTDEFQIVEELPLDAKRVHGLALATHHDKLLVHVLEREKPSSPPAFFRAAMQSTCALAYDAIEATTAPPHVQTSRKDDVASIVARLMAHMDTRFDAIENILTKMDARLSRLEGSAS